MKSICLVIPYFGTFPNYFDLWLESVRYNPNVNFLLITDNEKKYDFPSNVIIKKISFGELREKIQKMFPFKIALKKPYKICDYKAAYGDIFSDELQGYDFWGHCDVDLIFGDIRKFVKEDILDKYDKINLHGHFSLFRNNEEMRFLYKKQYKDIINYKEAFSTNWMYHFDEYPGVALIIKRMGIKAIDIEEYADIDPFLYRFRKVYDHSVKKSDISDICQIFSWKNGKLTNLIKNGKDILEKDVMYIHLQRRKMDYRTEHPNKGYLIVPNAFIDYSDNIAEIFERYVVDKQYDVMKEFKKEWFLQKFRPTYWKMQKTMLLKKSKRGKS